MNRISFGLAALSILSFTACHKGERPEPKWEISSQLLEVQGTQELLFTLPENFQEEDPIISAKPSNASTAELFRNDAGQWTLRYRSADGKSGLDNLSIDSEDEAAERAAHQGKCGGNGFHLFGKLPHKHGEKEGHYRLQLEISVQEMRDALRKPVSGNNFQ